MTDERSIRREVRRLADAIGGDGELSIRVIARLTGVSPSTAMRGNTDREVGWSTGLDGRVRPNRRLDTTERDKRIAKLYAAGKSMRAIAAQVGCSVGTVHRVVSAGGRVKPAGPPDRPAKRK